MACLECEERRRKLREAILRGKIAEAAGHVVAGVREMVEAKPPAEMEIVPADSVDLDGVDWVPVPGPVKRRGRRSK